MKVLIIGGMGAGMSVAAKLKRSSPDTIIKVFEHGPDVSYGTCGLPYYVSGLYTDANLMRVRSVAEFEASGIDVAMGHSVLAVDAPAKELVARNMTNGQEYRERYDKLVIATGTTPIVPPLPGVGLPGIFTLKTIPDGQALRQALLQESVRQVVIIGAGYIGMEMVESCVLLGKKVRVIEMKEQTLPPMDVEIARLAQDEAEKHGVVFNLGEAVSAFAGHDRVHEVLTNKGRYQADLVLLSIGVSPNTKFLQNTGIATLPNGAIITDQQMRTNLPDIFAAGDCCAVWHKLLHKPVYLPLGTNANKQGRHLAQVLVGQSPGFPGALGTAVLKMLNLEMGRTGITEAEAKQNNLACASAMVEVMNHPPYFPNSTPIYIKLTYNPESKVIIGAQLAGAEGAAARLATMAAVIDRQMTATELGNLDLPYSPPFAQVWDALHVAAAAIK